MTANLFGPVEGKRHDCAILAMPGLLQTLQRYSHGPNGEVLWIFGDPAYLLRTNLLAPYNGAKLTQEQTDFNSSMSKVRVTVEWMFGEVTILNPQISNNAHTCLMLILVYIKAMFRNILPQTHHYLKNIFNEQNYALNVFLY